MKYRNLRLSLVYLLLGAITVCSPSIMAASIAEALAEGKSYGDLRLRYESVDQDNNQKDADALTLRTRLGYQTGEYEGFSATVEFEDSRSVAGMDDYNNANGMNTEYSVIADPKSSELDQGFIQYHKGGFTSKLGRQVVVLDNHRFVGHVGWRQDRQVFDGFSAMYTPIKNLAFQYVFIDERNRIFADEKDVDSKDHLFNASYKTPVGKITGYAYLLETDNDTDNGLDTFGLRFSGSQTSGDFKWVYTAELAGQEFDNNNVNYDAEYLLLEAGFVVGKVTTKLGYELLGSDEGSYGFSTPLATLHKFNGWADQFLNTPAEGLIDTYLSVSGHLFGGKWLLVYHDFDADENSDAIEDLGDEVDLSYAKKFGKTYSVGVKYASYRAGDIAVDTDKLWVWLGASF